VSIPQAAVEYGFVIDGLGPHSSRTIMLEDLELLLTACPRDAGPEVYRAAVLDDNVLLKATESTRRKSFRHLREMYGLDPCILLFRALADLWDQEAAARPMLALLCGIARDPSLRATARVILDAQAGVPVTAAMMSAAMQAQYPVQLAESTLASVGRNTLSSWTQTGHVQGRANKVRSQAHCHPISLAFALLLGYLCGERGDALLHTLWARLLDAPPHILREQAVVASRQGWLEYRHAGDVTDISFHHLMREGSHE
jgi:hypothetical protein